MPTVFFYKGYRFYFWSNEGTEPLHIHVEHGNKTAKYWLEPILLEYNHGFTNKELKVIELQVKKNLSRIREVWNEHFKK